MWTVRIDSSQLEKSFNQYAQGDIAVALVRALNDVAFDARVAWQEAMPQLFDRPVPLTLDAVIYKKASIQEPVAEVFIRDQATKGTPPAKYLLPQVLGGTRGGKRSENLLRAAGILGGGEFWVPGQQARLDAHGNLPKGVVTAILSDVHAQFDPLQNSTVESRAKRVRRGSGGRTKTPKGGILKEIKRKARSRGGVYFLSRGKGTQVGPRRIQHLSRGIYERITTGFGGTVRMVMAFVKNVSYQKRFDPLAITQGVVDRNLEARFKVWIDRLGIR